MPNGRRQRRCLIVERHGWETGGDQQQLQFLLQTAREFFGPDRRDRNIHVRVFMPATAASPTFEQDIVISRRYKNGTRRTNGFPQMGSVPPSFVFFEETTEDNTYDVWWEEDKAIVAARFEDWQQGHNTQYRRGRLSKIVNAPVPRRIVSLS